MTVVYLDGVNLGPDSRVALLAELRIPAVATDLGGSIRHWNPAAALLYGRDEGDMLGTSLGALRLSPEDEAIAPSIVRELLDVGSWQGELEITDASGGALRLEARATVLVDHENQPVGFEAAFADLSARVAIERRAAESESRLRQAQRLGGLQAALLDQIDVSVIVTDLNRRVSSWNAGAERLYGWTSAEAIGRSPGELLAPTEAGATQPMIAAVRREVWDGEYVVSRKDGSSFLAYFRNRVMTGQDGHAVGFVGVSMDISDRKEAERAMSSARDYHRAVADSMGEGMFTLDVGGRATYVNPAAEDLLGRSSESLTGCDMHALTHNRRADGSPLPVEECPILHARRDGKLVRVEDDIFIRPDGSELAVAYTAAPFATEHGLQGCVVVFEDITARKAAAAEIERDLEKLVWVERIQSALAEKRLVLTAQPIIDVGTGEVVQRELLLRMIPPDGESNGGELIAPGAFLPVAEEFGLITEIDRWVIDRATVLAATGLPVQVNVSGRSISVPGFVDHIETAIDRTGADPGSLVFEITETALVSDETASRAFVEGLHRLGCQVALDDFGTGYGGFTYLKQLPIDFLKVDVEFVADMRTSSASRNVVQAIVNLAVGFGLKTVGEGVEDEETLTLLRQLGVDYAQGFYIGRPVSLELASKHHATQGDLT